MEASAVRGKKWYAGETISVAIGQGAVTVSPLQIANALGGIGAGGKWYKPHLLKDEQTVLIREANLSPRQPREGDLGYVCGGKMKGGTGRAAALSGDSGFAGRLGTAQLAATEKVKAGKGTNKSLNKQCVGLSPLRRASRRRL